MKFLLGGGASFTLVDDGGRTCLHYACYVHDIPVMRFVFFFFLLIEILFIIFFLRVYFYFY